MPPDRTRNPFKRWLYHDATPADIAAWSEAKRDLKLAWTRFRVARQGLRDAIAGRTDG